MNIVFSFKWVIQACMGTIWFSEESLDHNFPT